MILFADLETFSETPITHGTHKYAEKAEVLLWAYAFDDEPAVVWDVTANSEAPGRLLRALENPDCTQVWHNGGMFDLIVLQHAMGIDIPLERVHDTMVQALSHSLPGSLGDLCSILGVDVNKAKDKDGRRLILKFCKPQAKNAIVKRCTRETHPEDWAKFMTYARLDVEAMREVYRKLPKWNMTPAEVELWRLDQRINRRGMCVDLDLAKAAVTAIDLTQKQMAKRTQEITDGAVASTTQRDVLLRHVLSAYGVDLPDMTQSTLERRLNDPDLPVELRELLAIRLQASTTSTAKYKRLLETVSADGRLRGTKQFNGASRTGRWAGRLFQPDNLPRPDMEPELIDIGVDALKVGAADLIFPDVMALTSNAIRGCIVAPTGRKLVAADLSNIEGRDIAWLAGEEWKLQAFRDFDAGEGPDLYKLTCTRMLGIGIDEVTGKQRQEIGKTTELACLGADTKVVTNHGVKRIVDVAIDDLLWDGEQWVNHKGLVARSVRLVVNVAGIKVTPAHSIKTRGRWLPAWRLASSENILHQALATGSANLPWSASNAFATECAIPTWFGCSARVAHRLISYIRLISAKENLRAAMSAPRSSLIIGVKNILATRMSSLMRGIAAVFSTEFPPVIIGVATPTMLATSTMEGEVSRYFGERTVERFCNISSHLKDGITQFSNSTASMWIKDISREICALLPGSRTEQMRGKFKKCSNASSISNERIPTYDIAYSGPKNCFTVLSDRGPLIVHNCGFQGAVGAFVTFGTAFGIDLEALAAETVTVLDPALLEKARGMLDWTKRERRPTFGLSDRAWIVFDAFKQGWRDAQPRIVALWHDLESAALMACDNPGKLVSVRHASKGPEQLQYVLADPVPDLAGLKMQRDGTWLRIRLPSGRCLCYPGVRVEDRKISYMGVNQYSRKWERIKTYGGKFAEQCTQASSRDVLAHGMTLADAAGYGIVLTVHDEIITEVPDTDEFSVEGLVGLMSTNPPWAPGLPLAAAGFEAQRYRKE